MTKLTDLVGEYQALSIAQVVNHPFDPAANCNAIQLCALPTEQYKLGIYFTIIIHEDPDDGYRSHADFLISNSATYTGEWLYFRGNFALRIPDDTDFHGFEIVNLDNNETILTAGTNNCNDYYPYFTFHFNNLNLTQV